MRTALVRQVATMPDSGSVVEPRMTKSALSRLETVGGRADDPLLEGISVALDVDLIVEIAPDAV